MFISVYLQHCFISGCCSMFNRKGNFKLSLGLTQRIPNHFLSSHRSLCNEFQLAIGGLLLVCISYGIISLSQRPMFPCLQGGNVPFGSLDLQTWLSLFICTVRKYYFIFSLQIIVALILEAGKFNTEGLKNLVFVDIPDTCCHLKPC